MSHIVSRICQAIAVCCILAFSACGFAQGVTLSPSTLAWGNVEVGQTAPLQTVMLTNHQSTPLTISGVALPLGSDFIQTTNAAGNPACPMSAFGSSSNPPTLPPGGSCIISMAFRPLAAGARTSTMSVLDDAPGHVQQVSLAGQGVIGPLLFSPTLLTFENVAVGATSTPQNVTLTNQQTTAVAISGLTVSSQFTQTNNCPASLAPGASCSLSVAFAPTAAGYPTGAVTVSFTAGAASSLQLYLAGATTLSYVKITPAAYDFGNVQINTSSAAQSFTVTNSYTQPVTIASIATTLPQFTVSSSTCPASPATLASNASCNVMVTFKPTQIGSLSDALTVTHNAPGSRAAASLTGTGVSTTPLGNGLSFSPTSLAWAKVPVGQTSGAKVITATNTDPAPITISSLATGNEFSVTATTCPTTPATLAAGANCTISVNFHPLAQGPRSDNLTVLDNGPQGTQQVPLSGVGSVGSVLFSPTSLSFPDTTPGSVSAAQNATLTNMQTTPLALTSFRGYGMFQQTNNCPASLAPNASCTVSVTFAPLSNGPKSGGILVTFGASSAVLYASGDATGGMGGGSDSISISPKRYTFPDQAAGTVSAPELITVTNNQSTAASISSIQIGAPFVEKNNCGSTLAAGASCTITLTYAPPVKGYTATNLTITDNAAGSPQFVPIAGNSIDAVTVMPRNQSITFFRQLLKTQSSSQTITITNNESASILIRSITATADFPFTTNCTTPGASGTLDAHSSCTISVSFDPQFTGIRNSTMDINTNAPGTPIKFAMYGSGFNDPSTQPAVYVAPNNPCVGPSGTLQFAAQVVNATNNTVAWYVDNVLNGNASVGTITPAGLYTAPPASGSHTIGARIQPSAKSNTTLVTVTTNPSLIVYPYTASLLPGAQQTFDPQLCQVPDTHPITYAVDDITGGNATVGTITNGSSTGGVYTAPATAGTHTIRAIDSVLNKSVFATVTVTSGLSADFGSRADTSHPIPAELFGFGRAESLRNSADAALLASGGMSGGRLYAAIPAVFATTTPDWTKIDPFIANLKAGGIRPILQMALTPPWLQPNPNTCAPGVNNALPTDVNKWGQIAAAYVAHMDATFPGLVQDYEIWNEPNTGTLCSGKVPKLQAYESIYAAAAPLMRQQAAADGATIRIGGPVTAGLPGDWFQALLSNPATAPYVDFVSYHQYIYGTATINATWDTYNGIPSMYQRTQDYNVGAAAVYTKAENLVKAGSQPLGANTPIYITEYNTNYTFAKDCCRNDPTYAPVWNALYVSDLFDTIYSGTNQAPGKLVYFAGNAYPYICLIGTVDANLDCEYQPGGTPQPYPQYYTYQLLGSTNYLGLVNGGFLATSVQPHAGAGGPVATAFYDATQDAILITNPTSTNYGAVPVTLNNVGFTSPVATLYQIVNGASINSSSLSLSAQGSGFTTTVNLPPYSVQAISLRGN